MILNQPFTIEYVSAGRLESDAFGKAIVSEQRLMLRDGMAGQQERDTLLHELLHACGQVVGHELEEHEVAALTPVLLGVLRSNPDVVTYLMEPMVSAGAAIGT
jgi:hypothetical protein